MFVPNVAFVVVEEDAVFLFCSLLVWSPKFVHGSVAQSVQ